MSGGEIVKSDNHALVVGGASNITSFFLPEDVGAALKEANLTLPEILKELGAIAHDKRSHINDNGEEKWTTPPRERLAAMKMALEVVKGAAVSSGLIERISGHAEKSLPDGTRVTLDAEGLRVAQQTSQRTLSTLELLESGDNIIDVEATNADQRSGPTSEHSTDDGPSDGGTGVRQSDGTSPGSDGSDGAGESRAVHGGERPDATDPLLGEEGDNEGTTGGAEDERSGGVSQQSGGGIAGQGSGETVGGDARDVGSAEWWNTTLTPGTRPTSTATGRTVHPIVPGSGASTTDLLKRLFSVEKSGHVVEREDSGSGCEDAPDDSVD